jgi:hypothetical protein
MSIYKRDDVFPQWEPVPWTSKGKAADEQERGFHQRALKPLLWEKIPWDQFPDSGIFGHQKAWLLEKDIQHFATFDGEDLFLIDNNWFGFPDPPRWGLVSRPVRQPEIAWQHWGHFPDLPDAWQFPG